MPKVQTIRTIVIGCGGAGKSTFSRQLGEICDVPVIHLDTIFWKPGWKSIARDDFIEAQQEILQQPNWIIDGHFGGTLEIRIAEAKTVVYFDFPTYLCLWGAFKRWCQFYFFGRKRPDMTEGNAEKLDLDYLGWILEYRRTRRPRIMKLLNEIKTVKEVVVFRSRQDVYSHILHARSKRPQDDRQVVRSRVQTQNND